ncbi:MAG: pyridoxamine 5'-phosphate oxidase [Actinobacteria bacterium 13_1_20CM_2_65_11]|nr:MAG: pyridoxamine 5'-phosphate oxidase [Chloroflexi bacterium 13_1_40CM_65_17]OLD24431.1 MAG: pyridoxamine 5'-phosphate oxidase [Chloroflexi bacterium 13_1_40CM_3_65_12]OLE80441.1 MAG: pyridoxamine 5'-phosphate oxidase [Actinobacteria bacterium 13_1_20CM_2_65_11]
MPLVESRMPADPLVLFRRWYREAEHKGSLQPDAIALATADARGAPSVRMVLFKGLDGRFIFFTNYDSRKGRDLAANNRAALVFYWPATRHQVRVSGRVAKLPRAASTAYFRSRPRGAQLSALASRQSRVVGSRAELERAVAELDKRYPETVPLPPDWGGYALRPEWIEFWENRPDRLHDRIRYVRRRQRGWRLERLAP